MYNEPESILLWVSGCSLHVYWSSDIVHVSASQHNKTVEKQNKQTNILLIQPIHITDLN